MFLPRARIACVAGVVVLLLTASTAGSALGQPGGRVASSATPQLTVITNAPIVAFLPLWLADWDGYYQRAGVDVTINQVPIPSLVATVASGRADVVYTGTGQALNAATAGFLSNIIYASASNQSSWVVGTKDVKTVADCTNMLTSGPGAVSEAWAHILQNLFHATYKITYANPIGSIAPPLLANGTANCAIGNQLFATVASGLTHVVLDPLTGQGAPAGMPLPGPESIFFGIKDNLAKKRVAVVRFLKAIHQAILTVKTMSPSTLATLAHSHPEFAPGSVDQLTADIQTNQPLFLPSGYISLAEWGSQVNIQSIINPNIVPSDPRWSWKQMVDMSYLLEAVPSSKPALRVNASIVGSKATIGRLATGPVVITVNDRSKVDGFYFQGPGVAQRTTLHFVGTARWQVNLRAGTYVYGSLRHPSLRHRIKLK